MKQRKMTAEDASRMFPIGAKVKYFPLSDSPDFAETKIRSNAWALGHGELVIKVEGVTGCVLISHLELD